MLVNATRCPCVHDLGSIHRSEARCKVISSSGAVAEKSAAGTVCSPSLARHPIAPGGDIMEGIWNSGGQLVKARVHVSLRRSHPSAKKCHDAGEDRSPHRCPADSKQAGIGRPKSVDAASRRTVKTGAITPCEMSHL